MSNKILALFILVVAVVFVFMNPLGIGTEVAIQTSSAVQVPQAINDAIMIGITALLALGTAYVFQKIGLDLRQFSTPVAITLSAWVVGELQNVVNLIPEVYDPTLDFVFKVIVVLLGSVGLLVWRKRPAPPPATEPYNPSLLA